MKAETIANCFRKAGFQFAGNSEDQGPSQEPETVESSTPETRNIWTFIADHFHLENTDFLDFVSADDTVLTSGEMTVAEIISDVSANVSDGATGSQATDDDDDPAPPPVMTANEAWTCFKNVKRFLVSQEIDDSVLCAIQKVEDTVLGRIVEKATKQTKITDFSRHRLSTFKVKFKLPALDEL